MEEVELTHVNPTYARIRFQDGRESSVSLTDLAPCPRRADNAMDCTDSDKLNKTTVIEPGQSDNVKSITPITENASCEGEEAAPPEELHRSTRLR